jgi:MoxR-like ATPase
MDEILFLQNETEKVYIHEEIIAAVRNIVWATRKHSDICWAPQPAVALRF